MQLESLFIAVAQSFILLMQQGRNYFNHSNIQFSQFLQSQPSQQRGKVFNHSTQISSTFKQKSQEFSKIQTKFYNNHIFHSSHKYKVPVYQYEKPSRIGNEAYKDFYRTYRKFTKPYAELTKYADNLTKNKTLLRRKQFDLPATSDIQQKTVTQSKIFRLSKYQKQTLKESVTEPVQSFPPQTNEKFDRTISTQYQVYRKLYGKQRNKADKVGLNNSINRILAAEMINLQIYPSSAKQRSKTIES